MGSSSESDLGDVIGALVVLAGLVVIGAVIERQQAEEQRKEDELARLIDALLNEGPGNTLGDSSLSFSVPDGPVPENLEFLDLDVVGS